LTPVDSDMLITIYYFRNTKPTRDNKRGITFGNSVPSIRNLLCVPGSSFVHDRVLHIGLGDIDIKISGRPSTDGKCDLLASMKTNDGERTILPTADSETNSSLVRYMVPIRELFINRPIPPVAEFMEEWQVYLSYEMDILEKDAEKQLRAFFT